LGEWLAPAALKPFKALLMMALKHALLSLIGFSLSSTFNLTIEKTRATQYKNEQPSAYLTMAHYQSISATA